MGALAHHVHWVTDAACLPLDRSVVFHRDVIEDYIAHGTPTLGQAPGPPAAPSSCAPPRPSCPTTSG